MESCQSRRQQREHCGVDHLHACGEDTMTIGQPMLVLRLSRLAAVEAAKTKW